MQNRQQSLNKLNNVMDIVKLNRWQKDCGTLLEFLVFCWHGLCTLRPADGPLLQVHIYFNNWTLSEKECFFFYIFVLWADFPWFCVRIGLIEHWIEIGSQRRSLAPCSFNINDSKSNIASRITNELHFKHKILAVGYERMQQVVGLFGIRRSNVLDHVGRN